MEARYEKKVSLPCLSKPVGPVQNGLDTEGLVQLRRGAERLRNRRGLSFIECCTYDEGDPPEMHRLPLSDSPLGFLECLAAASPGL